jgi:hypothetical protein
MIISKLHEGSFNAPVTVYDQAKDLFNQVVEGIWFENRPQADLMIPSIHFHAKTTINDNLWRICNNVIFAVAAASLFISTSGLVYGISSACMLLAARKIAAVAVGYIAYPKAILSLFDFSVRQKFQDACIAAQRNLGEEALVEEVVLHIGGVAYSAVLVRSQRQIGREKYVMHALGNMMGIEENIEGLGVRNLALGCNTLLINGPSVGKGGGVPTAYQMGMAFEAGLQFLEGLDASHIVMEGFSLGGGMLGAAIEGHEFKKDALVGGSERVSNGGEDLIQYSIPSLDLDDFAEEAPSTQRRSPTKYMFVADRTFRSLSAAAAGVFSGGLAEKERSYLYLITPILQALGLDFGALKASLKLMREQIPQIIVNGFGARGDGVITGAAGLESAIRTDERADRSQVTFLGSSRISHNKSLSEAEERAIHQIIKGFIKS